MGRDYVVSRQLDLGEGLRLVHIPAQKNITVTGGFGPTLWFKVSVDGEEKIYWNTMYPGVVYEDEKLVCSHSIMSINNVTVHIIRLFFVKHGIRGGIGVASVWLAMTPVTPTTLANNGIKIYTIYNYGGLVIAAINKSILTYLGDGYWLIVLPDTKYSEFADKALNQIAPYLHIGEPEILLHVAWSGKTFITKINETRCLSGNIWEIYERVEKFLRDVGRRGLAPAEMKMFIEDNDTYIVVGGAGKLDVDEFARLAHQYFKDFSKRVIVVEKFGWLPPGGPYQRMEMLDALRKVPCFFSFGEAVYGTSMIFNASCVKEMARKKNIACDDAVEHIVGKVKKLNPLIRKYLPWQEILIVIAKTPKLIIPTGMTLINTSKPSPEVQVETTQTEKQSQNTMITATYYEEEYTLPHQLMLITLIIIAVIIIVTVTIKYKVA
ncbi:MAG: hypothetical protein DRJ31_10800 [Candidatus Methanomethylicota archaeon]|uniref:Uncharacterized protein n=1 Tax=Thermoproteota archaeon TaxID=2056631 RepID=A0A497ELE3_9CREN|nr:MAG: hypothetical protein DRJ31_10800 [Candidatus Verstraetearchaeota archaeon]